ncbi:MAG: thiamine phosphate synthase [Cycloclasticus sp. symbiont of Bathymodiolus heckerae]|nr:MAG: thiamine phosphate synthase [Cycloclasticus sp. symbiont of Bathymodiolus heckerae]
MGVTRPNSGLYVITPDMADSTLLLHKVEQVLKGRVALLQYRDKTSNPEQRLLMARALHTLCLKYKTPLIINDDPQLALACHAEGVHLGQSDGSIKVARTLLGEKAIIGMTCHHDISLAIAAQKQGANYVAFGRFFHSSTKPGEPLATTDLLKKAAKQLSIPIVAIGGLTLKNAEPIIKAGANYTAVVDAAFSSSGIAKTCQQFAKLF